MNLLRPLNFLLPVVVGTSMLMAATTLTAQAATSTPTPKTLINDAKASMLAAKGVHIDVVTTHGKTKSSIVVDVGIKNGAETILSGKQNVKIVVTPKNAYLSGNTGGLTAIMGLTAAEAKKLGSSVMVMKAGSTEYTSLDENLTTPILAGMLPALTNKSLKVVKGSAKNQYALSWSTAASSTSLATTTTLVFTTGAKTLPTSESIKSSSGVGTTTFTKWNESVKVTVPSKSSLVTYAHVFG